MIRLEKFYDLISRNATVTLTNRQLDTTFFEGCMRDIPDRFSNCIVEDFCVSNTGDFLFKIKVNPVPQTRKNASGTKAAYGSTAASSITGSSSTTKAPSSESTAAGFPS